MNRFPVSPFRIQRIDGWTPERIHTFLRALAGGSRVAEAARSAGMSRQGAYAFRRSANGQAFATAWRDAQARADVCRRDAAMAGIRARRLRRLRRLVPPSHLARLCQSELREWRAEPEAG